LNSRNVLILHSEISSIQDLIDDLELDFSVTSEQNYDNVSNILQQSDGFACVLLYVKDNSPEIIEKITKISEEPILTDSPFIALLDKSDIELENQLMNIGFQDYIYAPFNSRLANLKISQFLNLTEATSFVRELEIDELTGLYTRRAFLRRAKQIIDSHPENQYAIIASDFTNFKFTNSQYGEEKCNEYLTFIGKALKDSFSEGLAGRYGGDQFIGLIKYRDEVNTKYLWNFIQKELAKSPIPHQKLKVGIYAPIDRSLSIPSCCDRAFLSIREIKEDYDKDIIFYDDSLRSQLEEEQKILSSMEAALEKEQFVVYYQPKHESVTGRIAGCEALVRWIHPEFGFMNPGQFIPLFEKNGFITNLDSFVVRKVCEDIIRWKKEGIPIVPVSINVSRRDYLEQDWMKSQVALIDRFNVDHSLIHFEVTESLYAEYMDMIIEQVRQVQMQDFMIEMDDFGAGYSSLGLLATFPLNVIKLDISFVRHIEINEIIIENIIKMAHKMGLSVIAEGAETKEQFQILKTLGCDLIQGYCFSKPLACNDFEAYIKRYDVDNEELAKSLLKVGGQEDYRSITNSEMLLKATSEIGDTIPGGYISYHADGNREIITFNREVLKIWECDYTEEFRAFTGNSFNGLIPPEEFDHILKEINQQVKEVNDTGYVSSKIITKKGNTKIIQAYGRLVKTYKYGNIFYVFLRDITELYEQNLETQKNNEVIQGLSRSFSCIYLIEFEKNKMTPYAISDEYRPIIMQMLENGWTYDDVVVGFCEYYVVEEERKKIEDIATIENIKKQFETTDYYCFTFHIIKDGRVRLTELAIRKLKDENEEMRAVLTFRSVSENMISAELERNQELVNQLEEHKIKEKQTAEELQKAYEAAEIANKARALLISKFADDIKTPLVEIKNSLGKASDSDDIIEALPYINEVSDSTEKILRMVSNVQLGAKVGTELENTVNYTPTDCSMAINKLLMNIEEQAKKKNIQLKTWSNFYNPLIYQDMDKTSQITLSIIDNALKYTPEGGTVSFGLEQIPCEDNPDECIIDFTCKDTGIGISEEFLSHIYEPFVRERNEINNKNPSSGLGLTIAKALIEMLNGTIEIKSSLGIGTEVKVIQRHKFLKDQSAKQI